MTSNPLAGADWRDDGELLLACVPVHRPLSARPLGRTSTMARARGR